MPMPNRGRTRVAFPRALAVNVTKEISNRKNFNGQIFSGRIDEGFKKRPSLHNRAAFYHKSPRLSQIGVLFYCESPRLS